jgi:Fe2+ transport system protein FeoA
MILARAARGQILQVTAIGGSRSFRRRLMELGLVPGTRVEVVGKAPLGDPIELLVRGCSLSIRGAEAAEVSVEPPRVREELHARRRACGSSCGACMRPRAA